MNDQALYDRLVARILKDKVTGCWNWTGPSYDKRPSPGNRYGYIGRHGHSITTHRAMWIALHGMPAKGLCVCHRCDNPKCVNPEHLWLGTHLQNMADCRRKNRYYYSKLTHCKRGHEFTPENTYYIKTPGPAQGLRQCRTCQRERQRERWRENPDHYNARKRAWRARKK